MKPSTWRSWIGGRRVSKAQRELRERAAGRMPLSQRGPLAELAAEFPGMDLVSVSV
jgi:hypothetical protein